MEKQRWIIGIDEVGRGPLAGPVTVAAVAAPIFPPKADPPRADNFSAFKNIRNSKKLSAIKREEWREKICADPRLISAITSVYPHTIDRVGIVKAAHKAVASCLRKIVIRYKLHDARCMIVLDGGLYAPARYLHQHTIIKGDEHHPLIAAASIIAKVHRDRTMTRLHKKLPQYGFDRHKGYGTKQHEEALRLYGTSGFHRTSFCKKFMC